MGLPHAREKGPCRRGEMLSDVDAVKLSLLFARGLTS